jgi:hypothetical protein
MGCLSGHSEMRVQGPRLLCINETRAMVCLALLVFSFFDIVSMLTNYLAIFSLQVLCLLKALGLSSVHAITLCGPTNPLVTQSEPSTTCQTHAHMCMTQLSRAFNANFAPTILASNSVDLTCPQYTPFANVLTRDFIGTETTPAPMHLNKPACLLQYTKLAPTLDSKHINDRGHQLQNLQLLCISMFSNQDSACGSRACSQ